MYSLAEQEIKTRTGSSKLSEVEVGRGRELGWNKDCVYFLVMKQMRNWAQLIIGLTEGRVCRRETVGDQRTSEQKKLN